MTKIYASVADFREAARQKIPKTLFDYIDGGSFGENTLRANVQDFEKFHFRQSVLRNVAERSMETRFLGQPSALPCAIAPTGLTGLLVPGGVGEIQLARAAKQAGIPYILAVLSIVSMEELHAATGQPFWFQTKPYRDRGALKELFARALALDCPVLVITVDGQVMSQHYRGVRNGLGKTPAVRWDNFLEYAARPIWSAKSKLRGSMLRLGNLEGSIAPRGFWNAMAWVSGQLNPALEWRDLDWIRENWPKKLVIKGILDAQDASSAISLGADAISVSNHGGNQLDGAPSAISALPAIVGAASEKLEILLDGGIRTGQDIFKALALGAKACLLGRAPLYGLAAREQSGATSVLEILRQELDTTMALTGVQRTAEISSENLWNP